MSKVESRKKHRGIRPCRACWPASRAGAVRGPTGCLEEISDRKLEYDRIFARLRRERQAPLEAQGPDGREPAEPETPARARVDRIERLAGITEAVEPSRPRQAHVAVPALGVEGVAGIHEHHAPDADLLEDRELDLGVAEQLDVASDVERDELLV